MSALVFLFIALVLSGIGSAVLVMRNRRPTSVESGIDEFRREMNALAPPDRPRRPRRQTPAPPDPVSDADALETGDDARTDDPPARSIDSDADPGDPASPAEPSLDDSQPPRTEFVNPHPDDPETL